MEQRGQSGRKVFISYARDDDEPFVHRLHDDLTRLGVPVWWDRAAMESRGQTFLQVIRDAIANQCSRLLLIVGPRAVSSDYVRFEWEHALEYCKVIVPVIRGGDPLTIPGRIKDSGFNLTPKELASFHSPDFRSDAKYEEALDELIRILMQETFAPGKPSGVEWTSAHYVARPEYLEKLKRSVLADVTEPTVITSALQTTALQGMGGIGKSVLAAAFGRACFTRRSFTDGVIWLTFGRPDNRRPDIVLVNLRRVGVELADPDLANADADAAPRRLADCLAQKACLLILDDVWEQAHAYAFVRAAENTRSRVLLTTRDGGLARSLNAVQCDVDVLGEEAALQLLAKASATRRERLPAMASDIARECGYLPLGLAMVGAMVAGRPSDRWQDALTHLSNADLARIRHTFPEYADKPNLLVAMQVSVDSLAPALREKYFDFAVFAEDERVPEAVFLTFWKPLGLDESQARKTIDGLVDRSLVRRDGQGLLSLHDIQHDYLQKQGGQLGEIRARFLDSYRQRCSSGDWPTGPNDGYFFQHLVEQLVAAERDDEVHRLLALDAEKGGNGWQRATEAAGLSSSYVSDLDRASRLASNACTREVRASGCAASVARQIRYGLMRSSLAAVGRNLPISILVAMYRRGLNSPERLLDRAQSLPDQDGAQLYRKLETLWSLGEAFTDPHSTRAFQIALTVARSALASKRFEDEQVANPLASLIRRMPATFLGGISELVALFGDVRIREELAVFLAPRYAQSADTARAFAIVRGIEDSERRARALRDTSVFLSPEHLDEARAVLSEMDFSWYRGLASPAVAARLAALGYAREAIELIRGIPHAVSAAEALYEVAGHLDDRFAKEALDVARATTEYSARLACAMARLAQRLQEPARSAEVAAVWQDAYLRWDKAGEQAREELLPELPIELLRDVGHRLEMRSDLRIPYVVRLATLGHPEAALDLASACNEHERASLLGAIVANIGEDLIHRALEVVGSIEDSNLREAALRHVLPRLAALGYSRDALERAVGMDDVFWRARALENMAPYLQADDLGVAAQHLISINDGEQREATSRVLAAFVPDQPPAELAVTLSSDLLPVHLDAVLEYLSTHHPDSLEGVDNAILRIEDDDRRLEALLLYAKYARNEMVGHAVRLSWKTLLEHGHLERLLPLLPRLPDNSRTWDELNNPVVWQGFKKALQDMFDPRPPTWAAALAQLGQAEAVLSAIREVRDKTSNPRRIFQVTAAVQPFLASPERERVLSELIQYVEGAANPYDPIIDIRELEHLSQPLALALVKVLRTRCEIRNAETETSRLASLLADLGDFDEALALANELRASSPYLYVRALAAVAGSCGEDLLEPCLNKAIDAAVRITNPVNDPSHRSEHLAGLVRPLMRLSNTERLPLWTKLMEGLMRYPRDQFLMDLSVMAPIVAGLGGGSALASIRDDISNVARWWP